jgi:DNA damage-binding protein 1
MRSYLTLERFLPGLAEFFCEAGEEISALELLSISDDATYLCVGTVYNLDLELEPSKGRLVFLKIHTSCNTTSSQMQLSQVVVIPTQGCVYALTTLGQMLAIAANSSVRVSETNHCSRSNFFLPQVVLFKISELDAFGQGLHVEKTASWNHNYVVTSLVSNGNTLIVGDVINSISVLEVSSTGLTIKARDYTPLWPYRIQSLDNNNVVGGNVRLFGRN